MPFLTLTNVSLTFPQSYRPALQHIDYEINSRDFVILLGGNGSGKSSLLKLLNKEYRPSAGEIKINKKESHDQAIAHLTQDCDQSLYPSLTVFENFLLVKNKQFSIPRSEPEKSWLGHFLQAFNPNLTTKLDVLVHQLSGGEKQAFALALSLLHPPALLLLDEHTSALDPKTSAQIMALTNRMVKLHHITCVLTTHDLDIALKYGNRLMMLREGKIHKIINQDEKKQLTKEILIRLYQ